MADQGFVDDTVTTLQNMGVVGNDYFAFKDEFGAVYYGTEPRGGGVAGTRVGRVTAGSVSDNSATEGGATNTADASTGQDTEAMRRFNEEQAARERAGLSTQGDGGGNAPDGFYDADGNPNAGMDSHTDASTPAGLAAGLAGLNDPINEAFSGISLFGNITRGMEIDTISKQSGLPVDYIEAVLAKAKKDKVAPILAHEAMSVGKSGNNMSDDLAETVAEMDAAAAATPDGTYDGADWGAAPEGVDTVGGSMYGGQVAPGGVGTAGSVFGGNSTSTGVGADDGSNNTSGPAPSGPGIGGAGDGFGNGADGTGDGVGDGVGGGFGGVGGTGGEDGYGGPSGYGGLADGGVVERGQTPADPMAPPAGQDPGKADDLQRNLSEGEGVVTAKMMAGLSDDPKEAMIILEDLVTKEVKRIHDKKKKEQIEAEVAKKEQAAAQQPAQQQASAAQPAPPGQDVLPATGGMLSAPQGTSAATRGSPQVPSGPLLA
jgi:hypothetical protein